PSPHGLPAPRGPPPPLGPGPTLLFFFFAGPLWDGPAVEIVFRPQHVAPPIQGPHRLVSPGAHQRRHADLERPSQARQDAQGRIACSGLKLVEVHPTDTGLVGKLALAPAGRLAQCPKPLPELPRCRTHAVNDS